MVKQVYEKLSYVTTHDEITGLTNRKEIERSIERVLAKGIKSAGCSLIYVDLRQFKIINDSAGYDAGDRLLKDVAEILKSYAPKGQLSPGWRAMNSRFWWSDQISRDWPGSISKHSGLQTEVGWTGVYRFRQSRIGGLQ